MGYFIFALFLAFSFYLGGMELPTILDIEKINSAENEARLIVNYIDRISQLQYEHPALPITDIPKLIRNSEGVNVSHVSENHKLYLWVKNKDSLYNSLNNALGGSLILGKRKQGVIVNSLGDVVDDQPPQDISDGSLVLIFRD